MKKSDPSDRTKEYLKALATQPDKRCRETVVALRHGQRRRGLKQTILDGNEKGYFTRSEPIKDADGRVTGSETITFKIDPLELLHDCKTRWSSTRNMIERFLYLYPAISDYIHRNKEALAHYAISHMQFKVLQDILAVLDIPHKAQELLSAEKTPTLSLVFPVYGSLIHRLREAEEKYPALAFAIQAAIKKFEDYLRKSQSSPIHVIAMFLNPCVKYNWIDENLSEADQLNARAVVKRFIIMYLEAEENEIAQRSIQDLSTQASRALNRGLGNVLFDHAGVIRTPDYDGYMGVTPLCSPAVPRVAPPPDDPAGTSRISNPLSLSQSALTRRTAMAEVEHDRYLATPGWTFDKLGDIDLVKYWTIQTTQPILRRIAMDVLPAQASSVSSERVFSSSKLTCTRARNKISAQMVERLQILKYCLRHPSGQDVFSESHSGQYFDIVTRLDNSDWGHDAILDCDET